VGRFLNREPLRYLLPDALLVGARRCEERTGLAVDGAGRIVACVAEQSQPASDWERFPGEIWTAAPVLAHAHLDGWEAPTARFRRAPFAAWVRDLIAWRAEPARLSAEQSAQAAAARLAAAGCGLAAVHVGEAGAEGAAQAPLELLAWREVLDPFPSDDAESAWRRWNRAAPPCAGLALHAPYSVDVGLAREVFARGGGPTSLHLGETEDVRACLADGTGPLAELLAERRGRRPAGGHASPLAWLAEAGGLRGGTLAVHAGALRADELRALRVAGVAIVFCPGAHRWFERPSPRFAEAGVFPQALGCDSRASNEDLDPLREWRLALDILPAWSPEDAWTALTAGGARTLRRPHATGFARGASARALRLRDPRAQAAITPARDPARRAAALLRWLADCEDPALAGARLPTTEHAKSG
jgi:cytosine/adenosine deaminase-related metal-dependent hydrolase